MHRLDELIRKGRQAGASVSVVRRLDIMEPRRTRELLLEMASTLEQLRDHIRHVRSTFETLQRAEFRITAAPPNYHREAFNFRLAITELLIAAGVDLELPALPDPVHTVHVGYNLEVPFAMPDFHLAVLTGGHLECPTCGAPLQGAGSEGPALPVPGDYSICASCLTEMKFVAHPDGGLRFVKMLPEEMAAEPEDVQRGFARMRHMLATLKQQRDAMNN